MERSKHYNQGENNLIITRQQFRLEWGEGKIPTCVEKLFEERNAYRKVAIERHALLLKNGGCFPKEEEIIEKEVDAAAVWIIEQRK